MVMHGDTVTTSWRRLTDKVKGFVSDGVDDAFAGTSRALPQTTCAASRLNRPAAPADMPHAGLVSLSEVQPRRLTRQLRLHLAARIATERQPSRGHGWLLGRTKAARLQVRSKRACKGYDVRSARTAIDVTRGERRGLDGGVRKAPAPRG